MSKTIRRLNEPFPYYFYMKYPHLFNEFLDKVYWKFYTDSGNHNYKGVPKRNGIRRELWNKKRRARSRQEINKFYKDHDYDPFEGIYTYNRSDWIWW